MHVYKKVNDVEFDQPFRVGFGGVVTDAAPGIHGPLSVTYEDDAYHDVYIDCLNEEWQAFSVGYTGQWMAHGSAVMHSSEYIGGQLEADILATPGVYVVMSVECSSVACDDESSEPAGWIVLKRKTRRELRAEGVTRG